MRSSNDSLSLCVFVVASSVVLLVVWLWRSSSLMLALAAPAAAAGCVDASMVRPHVPQSPPSPAQVQFPSGHSHHEGAD